MTGSPQRLPDPPMLTTFALAHAVKRCAPGDIRATAQQRQSYLRFTGLGDPAADALVDMFRRLPAGRGRQMFDTAVEHGITAVEDPPEELRRFFDDVDDVPYWLDHDLLAHASTVVARTGAIGFGALTLALLGGYLAPRVAATLVATGELEHMAPRRLAQTTLWFTQVTAHRGLDRSAPGFHNTLRVRIGHAMVRARLARTPGHDLDRWEHPINQAQMAGTVMLFGWAIINGSQALGMQFSTHDRTAIYHMWRYVGFLLGVDPSILPTDENGFWRLLWLQADHEFRNPTTDSARLAQSLLHGLAPMIIGDSPRRWADTVVAGGMSAYARLALGAGNADTLGLADSEPFQVGVLAVAAVIRATEYPRRLLPGATYLYRWWGQRSQRALVDRITTAHRHSGARSPKSSSLQNQAPQA